LSAYVHHNVHHGTFSELGKNIGASRPHWLSGEGRHPPSARGAGATTGTCASTRSMTEMPHAGQNHRHLMLVRSRDDLLIANRAAGLDDCGDAGLRRRVKTVPEGEAGIRR